MIRTEEGTQKEQKGTDLLLMKKYCENIIDCHRKQLGYFGENFFDPYSECKETCDNFTANQYKIHMENKDNSSSSTMVKVKMLFLVLKTWEKIP